MQELFRFYAIRGPQPLSPEQTVSLQTQTPYQAELSTIKGLPERALTLSEVELRNTGETVRKLQARLGSALQAFATWATTIVDPPDTPDFDQLARNKIEELFGADAETLRAREEQGSTLDSVKDSIVALRVLNASADALKHYLGPDPRAVAAALVSYVRFLALLDQAGQPFTSDVVENAMTAKLVTSLADLANLGVRVVPPPPPAPTPAQRLAAAQQVMTDLSAMLVAIARACPQDLVLGPRFVVGPPPAVRNPDGSITVSAPPLAEPARNPDGGVTVPPPPVTEIVPVLNERARVAIETEFSAVPEALAVALNGGLPPSHPAPGAGFLIGGWRDTYVRYEAQAKRLQRIIDDLEAQIGQVAPTPPPNNEVPTPVAAGYMRLAGMTDVKVVRSHVVGYQGAEIAQIENVLQGETWKRKFRTLTRREEDTTTTNEKTTSEEKEIKTEDQSSLKSSVDSTLKESLDLKVGFDLKAKIGDTVQIGLNTSFGFSRSSEETKKASSDFAKDVTNRAAQKVSQTIRTTVETRLLEETEETVDHGFDAQNAQSNIVGLYQWIEKVNRVQIFTVGDQKRAVLDGVILQPGQRLLGATSQAGAGVPNIPAPPALDLVPGDIHPWNYLSLAAKFGATSLSPPPPLTTNISFSAVGPQGQNEPDKEQDFGVAQDLTLPDGTAAAFVTVSLSGAIHEAWDYEHVLATVGAQSWQLTGVSPAGATLKPKSGDEREIYLSDSKIMRGEQLAVPFTVFAGRVTGFSATVDLTCVRTQEAYEAWQLGVYAALRTANAKAQQDYNDQVARAQLAKSSALGPAPGTVENLVREELKRCVIAVLAKQAASGSYYDDIDKLYAAGSYADIAQRCLFFEHALEWENMTYILYPYYWADGRNDGWKLHLDRDEKDDDLVAFLKSGAARVVVPARPLPKDASGSMQDFAAYLQAMSMPSLAELIDVGTPLYLAIDQEIKDKDGIEAETFDDEWEVNVATELVRLRPDATLPTWSERKDDNGNVIKGDFVEDTTT